MILPEPLIYIYQNFTMFVYKNYTSFFMLAGCASASLLLALFGTESIIVIISEIIQLFWITGLELLFDWQSLYPLQVWSPYLITQEMLESFSKPGLIRLKIPIESSQRYLQEAFTRPVFTELVSYRSSPSHVQFKFANPDERLFYWFVRVGCAVFIISISFLLDALHRYCLPAEGPWSSSLLRIGTRIRDHWKSLSIIILFQASFSLGIAAM